MWGGHCFMWGGHGPCPDMVYVGRTLFMWGGCGFMWGGHGFMWGGHGFGAGMAFVRKRTWLMWGGHGLCGTDMAHVRHNKNQNPTLSI